MNYYIKRSMNNKVPISIIYLSKSGTITQRKILIKKIVNERVIAFCYKRNRIRSFSFDQMLSASFTNQTTAS